MSRPPLRSFFFPFSFPTSNEFHFLRSFLFKLFFFLYLSPKFGSRPRFCFLKKKHTQTHTFSLGILRCSTVSRVCLSLWSPFRHSIFDSRHLRFGIGFKTVAASRRVVSLRRRRIAIRFPTFGRFARSPHGRKRKWFKSVWEGLNRRPQWSDPVVSANELDGVGRVVEIVAVAKSINIPASIWMSMDLATEGTQTHLRLRPPWRATWSMVSMTKVPAGRQRRNTLKYTLTWA